MSSFLRINKDIVAYNNSLIYYFVCRDGIKNKVNLTAKSLCCMTNNYHLTFHYEITDFKFKKRDFNQ